MRQILFSIIFFLPIGSFAQVNHWESLILAEDEWNYFLGEVEPPTDWKQIEFDDSSWNKGAGSIGYADDDDNTIIPKVLSLYMRISFEIVDVDKIGALKFFADYDDGYVAYLNGQEISRKNLQGNPPAFDAGTPDFREALIYQGGQPIESNIEENIISEFLVNGKNVLSVQTHNYEGLVSSDLTTLYWLLAGITDESQDYRNTPPWFFDTNFDTNLPILQILTGGVPINDEPKIQAQLRILANEPGTLNNINQINSDFFGNISVEKRGQTSLSMFPKNGYALETKDNVWEDMDVSLLGLPEEEDWILHGPYSDKTLIRNVLAMHMARSIGQYASRTKLVELFVNDSYEGVYVLMERIKRDKNRVDIAKLNPEDVEGDELTGGYVIKLDKGPVDWLSQFQMINNNLLLRFQHVSPNRDKIVEVQKEYIKSYVDSFELVLYNTGSSINGKNYSDFIDLESFADHMIIQELTKNIDAYRISTYLYKDKDSNGGKLKAGPVWDFNLAFGNANYCNAETSTGLVYHEHCGIFNPFWWERLLDAPEFVNILNCRWDEFKAGPLNLETLFAYIDDQSNYLNDAATRNFIRWPVLDQEVWPNAVVPGTFQGELDYLKFFLQERMAWLDANFFSTCTTPTSEKNDDQEFLIFPNPTLDNINYQLNKSLNSDQNYSVQIYDQYGRLVRQQNANLNSGVVNIDGLQNGIYCFVLIAQEQYFSELFVIQR